MTESQAWRAIAQKLEEGAALRFGLCYVVRAITRDVEDEIDRWPSRLGISVELQSAMRARLDSRGEWMSFPRLSKPEPDGYSYNLPYTTDRAERVLLAYFLAEQAEDAP